MRGSNADSEIASFWNKRVTGSSNWWSNSLVVREYNRRVCGIPLKGMGAGIHELIATRAGRQIQLGISVGCGNGKKEMALLQTGAVNKMRCYDLSPVRIAQAKEEAYALGLSDRVVFDVLDAFTTYKDPMFDLVYWNNALHHMADVREAVKWSKSVLISGGLFAIDDFVGATRMQICDESIRFANSVRSKLPEKFWRSGSEKILSRQWFLKRIEKDPSECMDSSATLPSLREFFPGQEVIPTGGLLYFMALNGLYSSFDMSSSNDRSLLEVILIADEQYAKAYPDRTLYAAAVCVEA